MKNVAIRLSDLGKRYTIGQLRKQPDSLREAIAHGWSRQVRRLFTRENQPIEIVSNQIWALRNASLEIERGEIVGLIGRNGAGKSTLLKILSRVTDPTEGQAEIYGRVGSLLEVGTGFHPELTGRENVYLSGAILGMPRSSVQDRFDEIISFAEIERFIDTPVKHYSSGMYMRLAFAVAAHLEPDILIIDEVLAVGDAAFQRKCLGRLGQLRIQGRTIFLASHDMTAVRTICSRVVWLRDGQIHRIGSPEEITELYREYLLDQERANLSERSGAVMEERTWHKDAVVGIESVELLDQSGNATRVFETGEPLHLRIHYNAIQCIEKPVFGIGIELLNGFICYGCFTNLDGFVVPPIKGKGAIEVDFGELNLLPNNYRINVGVWDERGNVRLDSLIDAAFLKVTSSHLDHGVFFLKHSWHVVEGALESR